MFTLRLLYWPALALVHLVLLTGEPMVATESLPVPNPFDVKLLSDESFYKIASFQSTKSTRPNEPDSSVRKEEYFSLELGLTYILTSPRDKSDSESTFALLGDSPNGRSYYVRNPFALKSADIDCEIDHLHHQRHIYPWQYEYPARWASNDKRPSKRKSPTSSISGIGAIWLNAIQRKITSDLVGENSGLPSANLWLLKTGDLEIQLLFEKPDNVPDSQMPQAVAKSILHGIRLTRMNSVGPHGEFSATALDIQQVSFISILEFVPRVSSTSPEIKNLFRLLAACKRRTKNHRILPSLMREITLSPERMYEIIYRVTRYPRSFIGKESPNEISKALCRPVRVSELVHEWFSMRQESQMLSYMEFGNSNPDQRVDRFVRKFTEYENLKEKGSYKTAHYHIIEHGNKGVCISGERESIADMPTIVIHPIYFYRADGSMIHSVITGLGALLLNVDEFPHKEFTIQKRTMVRPLVISEDSETRGLGDKIKVDEWRVRNENQLILLYFKAIESRFENHHISDLIRVDIKSCDSEESELELVDNPDSDDNLIVRYDIGSFHFDAAKSVIDYQFNVKNLCDTLKPSDDDEEPAEKNDDHRSTSFWDAIFGPWDSDSDDQSDDEAEKDLENFELNPLEMLENYRFPDFFDFLFLRFAFAIDSKVRVSEKKFIFIKELFNTRSQLAQIKVYFNREPKGSDNPDLLFLTNFNQEVIFRLDYRETKCKVVDDYDPWMRLFSHHIHYNRLSEPQTDNPDQANWSGSYQESDALMLFGVGSLWRAASESESVRFEHPEKSRDKSKKLLSWSFNEDEDDAMDFLFKFSVNQEYYRSRKEKSLSVETRDLLKLESIHVVLHPDLLARGNFKEVSIEVINIDWSPKLDGLVLPDLCHSVEKVLNNPQIDARIPSFADSTKRATVYSAQYNVRNSENAVTVFKEWFDLEKKRGVISFNTDGIDRVIFLDGRTQTLAHYLKNTNQCQKIAELGSVFNFDRGFAVMAPSEVGDESFFGLAALWIRLQRLKDAMVHIRYRYDPSARKQEVRNIQALSSWRETQAKFIINAEFLKKTTQMGEGIFKLERVEFIQTPYGSISGSPELSHVTIEITEFQIYPSELEASPAIWDPPEACQDFLSSKPVEKAKFPSLVELINVRREFLMRSLVTELGPREFKDSRSSFIIEELIYNGDVRIKTQGLRSDLDLFIYPEHGELFDVSVQYTCRSRIPDRFLPPIDFHNSKLVEFWADGTTVVDKPYHVYYGALSLWRLAEKSKDKVKLSSKFEFGSDAPADKRENGVLEDYLQIIERDMRTEVWQYVSDDESWSYKMYFEQHSAQQQTWHTLERIELAYNQEKQQLPNMNIEIINYRYELEPDYLIGKFLLPEGYGCKRKGPSHEADRLHFDIAKPHLLHYEISASYPLKKEEFEQKSVEFVSGPAKTGIYASSGLDLALDNSIDFHVHLKKERNNDLKYKSSLEVLDKKSNTIQLIDRLTGKCESRVRPVMDSWTIELETPAGVETSDNKFYLSESVIRKLLMTNSGSEYQPFNAYELNGVVTRVYEKSGHGMFLVSGFSPRDIVIVRTFRYHGHLDHDDTNGIRLHPQVQLKIFLKSDTELVPQLIINMMIQVYPDPTLNHVLQLADLSMCYNRGLPIDRSSRKFAIQYKVDKHSLESFDMEALKGEFIKALVIYSEISVLQLVHAPEPEYSPESEILTVYFQLMEAPTALDYFVSVSDATNHQLEENGEKRLVSSGQYCSRWCDDANCVAMSYCEDRMCTILPLSEYKVLQETAKASNKDFSFALTITAPGCSYHFTNPLKMQPRLRDFVASMEKLIADQSYSWKTLGMTIMLNNITIWPLEFNEIDDEFEDLLEDSADLTLKHETLHTMRSYAFDYSINLERLAQIVESKPVGLVTSFAKSEADCLNLCISYNCFVSSFCKLTSDTCSMVIGQLDYLELRSVIEPKEGGCTVSIRDILSNFTKFDDTAKPATYEMEVEIASALDCATLCVDRTLRQDGTTFKCASFDHCLIKKEDKLVSECYLQSSHLLTQDFDRSIMLPTWDRLDGQIAGEGNIVIKRCDHYSRSVFTDFKNFARKKFKTPQTVRIEGLYADQCAMACQNDDQCVAFEYCYHKNQRPAQSCYYMKQEDFGPSNVLNETDLEKSESCSVYILQYPNEEYQLKEERGVLIAKVVDKAKEIFRVHRHTVWKVSSVFLIVLGSATLAAMIQFAYIRFFGRSILFET